MDTTKALLLAGYFPFSVRVCFLVCHPFIQQIEEEVKRFVMNIAVNYQQHYIRESFVEVLFCELVNLAISHSSQKCNPSTKY